MNVSSYIPAARTAIPGSTTRISDPAKTTNMAPEPVAVTQAELDKPISATTIAERLSYANDLKPYIEGADAADPQVLNKTIQLFAISTHNVIDHSLPQDQYMKRKLFCYAQWSLQTLFHCVTARLEMGYDTIDVDDIEKRVRTIHREPLHFTNPFARERHAVLRSDYEQMVNTPPHELSESGLPLHTLQTLLGEHVGYTQESTGIQVPLAAFHASASLGGDDRTLWKRRTSEFAVAVLICLAKSVSVKFRNHPLSLLDTMIPGSSFQ